MGKNKKQNIFFENFTLEQLASILKNLKAGDEHINQWLNHHEYERLLKIGDLNKKQKSQLQVDIEEKSGNLSRVLNTALTSILGLWIGFSDFVNQWQKSNLEIAIIVVACIFSVIAFSSMAYKLSKKNGATAIKKIKLANLQLEIIKIAIKKRLFALENISTHLSNILEKGNKIKTQFSKNKKNSEIEKIVLNNLKKISETIPKDRNIKYKSILLHLIKFINSSNKNVTKKILSHLGKGTIYTLTYPNLTISNSKPKQNFFQWLRNNKLQITIDLFPVLLGSAASFFVFLLGVPSAATKLGLCNGDCFFSASNLKIFLLSTSIIITIYFAISQCKYLFRSFKRNAELESLEIKISTHEEEFIRLTRIYNICMLLKEKLSSINLHNHKS